MTEAEQMAEAYRALGACAAAASRVARSCTELQMALLAFRAVALPTRVPGPERRPEPAPRPSKDGTREHRGDWMRARREALGLSRVDLCTVLGIKPSRLFDLEHNKCRASLEDWDAWAATMNDLEEGRKRVG